MRMRLILSVALPVCILLLGTGVLLYTRSVSLAFEEPVAQIETLARSSLYADITPQLDALDALWEEKRHMLQLFIDHHAIDNVSLELLTLRAAAEARSMPDTLAAAAQLREHAQHLLHRDLPLLENIL